MDNLLESLKTILTNQYSTSIANGYAIISCLIFVLYGIRKIYNKLTGYETHIVKNMEYKLIKVNFFIILSIPIIEYIFFDFVILYVELTEATNKINIICSLIMYNCVIYGVLLFIQLNIYKKSIDNLMLLINKIDETTDIKEEFLHKSMFLGNIIPIAINVYLIVFFMFFWLKSIFKIFDFGELLSILNVIWCTVSFTMFVYLLTYEHKYYAIRRTSIIIDCTNRCKCYVNYIVDRYSEVNVASDNIRISNKKEKTLHYIINYSDLGPIRIKEWYQIIKNDEL